MTENQQSPGGVTERGPSRAGDLTIETRGLLPVPSGERHGPTWRIATVWFSANMVPPTFFLGTLAAADFIGLGFTAGLFAILLGNLIGATMTGLMATMGPKTGMPQLALGRLSFGKSNVVPAFLNFGMMVAWTAVDTFFGAAAFSLLTGLPFWVGAVAVIIPMAIIVTVGYEAIMQFQKYMAIVLTAVFVVVAFRVMEVGDFTRPDVVSGADWNGSFILMVTISASFAMSWSVFGSDYTRYLPKNTSSVKVFLYAGGGLFVACAWLEILGLAVAHLVVGSSVGTIRDEVLGGGLLGGIAMVAIFLGIISVNNLNNYTGSLSLLTAGFRIPRPVSAIGVAVIALFVTLWLESQQFDQAFSNYLLLISYWVAPFGAVVLTDWWLRRRRARVEGLQELKALHSGWPAMASFLLGFVASIPFMNTDLYQGPIAVEVLHQGDIAYYIGFAVAAVSYLIIWKISPPRNRHEETGAAEVETEAADSK
jgi:NCS1 family nucleobase:cation symporter-1